MVDPMIKICTLGVDYIDMAFGIEVDEVDVINLIELKGEARETINN